MYSYLPSVSVDGYWLPQGFLDSGTNINDELLYKEGLFIKFKVTFRLWSYAIIVLSLCAASFFKIQLLLIILNSDVIKGYDSESSWLY